MTNLFILGISMNIFYLKRLITDFPGRMRFNELLEKASLKVGELNSFSKFVADVDIF